MLLEANLPKEFWSYAVRTSAYVRNRCFNPRTNKTPFELMTSKKPNVQNMHVFGSECYALVDNPKKLDTRSEKAIFIGYDNRSPAYMVYVPDKNIVRKVRVVKFPKNLNDNQLQPTHIHDDYISDGQPDANQNIPGTSIETSSSSTDPDDLATANNADEDKGNCNRYPARKRNMPRYLHDYVNPEEVDELNYTVHYCYRLSNIPRNYDEAVNSPDGEQWQQAMNDEMRALTVPQTERILSSKFIAKNL